jgi:hypothetical protein
MGGKLPLLELECSGCGHRWPTRARAGSTIKCPQCRRGHRVPATRPASAAAVRAVAAADDDGLAALWAAEAPPAPWHDFPGPEAGQCECGQPRHWTGAHTALICAGRTHERPAWSVSPGARTRAAEHVAAIDKSAASKSAQLADPEAERVAADTLEARRAELLDDLRGLADALNVTDFQRGDPACEPARRAGLQYGAIVDRYIERVHHADKLDQLDRAAADAERSLAAIAGDGGWLDRIEELRTEQSGRGAVGAIRGEVIYDDQDDDDGQGDDDEYGPAGDGVERKIRHVLERAAITNRAAVARRRPGGLRAGGLYAAPAPGTLGTYCDWCKRDHRYVGTTYPYAVARVAAGTMVPSPADVCTDHFAEARQRYGTTLAIHQLGRGA